MRPNWRRMLPWVAVVALALLAFGAVPHLHDEVDGQGDHCVLCHAQDAPFNRVRPPCESGSGRPFGRGPGCRSARPRDHAHGGRLPGAARLTPQQPWPAPEPANPSCCCARARSGAPALPHLGGESDVNPGSPGGPRPRAEPHPVVSRRVHPRECGGNARTEVQLPGGHGPSPRVRGKRRRAGLRWHPPGSIPASATETPRTASSTPAPTTQVSVASHLEDHGRGGLPTTSRDPKSVALSMAIDTAPPTSDRSALPRRPDTVGATGVRSSSPQPTTSDTSRVASSATMTFVTVTRRLRDRQPDGLPTAGDSRESVAFSMARSGRIFDGH